MKSNDMEQNLSLFHNEVLKQSGLSNETIKQRGYRTVEDPAYLRQVGFSKAQSSSIPCLYMPRFDIKGIEHPGIIRPDVPPVSAKGRAMKYVHRYGKPMEIDYTPNRGNHHRLHDPSQTI